MSNDSEELIKLGAQLKELRELVDHLPYLTAKDIFRDLDELLLTNFKPSFTGTGHYVSEEQITLLKAFWLITNFNNRI